ncbi:MAG: hypothetical protein NTV89_03670 [Proteobacteria bacterium]|nr:hypothetical protein [Pseudomonadota bacterium]
MTGNFNYGKVLGKLKKASRSIVCSWGLFVYQNKKKRRAANEKHEY